MSERGRPRPHLSSASVLVEKTMRPRRPRSDMTRFVYADSAKLNVPRFPLVSQAAVKLKVGLA